LALGGLIYRMGEKGWNFRVLLEGIVVIDYLIF
jgi:hypothetical protein